MGSTDGGYRRRTAALTRGADGRHDQGDADATVTNGAAVAAIIGGLGIQGRLVVVDAAEQPIGVPANALIGVGASIAGHASRTSMDSEDTLAFSSPSGVRPRIETMPLEQAGEAYARMIAGDARFWMVLTVG